MNSMYFAADGAADKSQVIRILLVFNFPVLHINHIFILCVCENKTNVYIIFGR